MTQFPPLHEDLDPLAPFIGTWRGTGHGDYPTIDPFDYTEELTFGHVGKPFVSLHQKTRRVGGAEEPLHAEAAYIRPADNHFELILVQPSGIVEIHTGGTITFGGAQVTLRFTGGDVFCTPSAKSVTDVVREYRVSGTSLSCDLWMAAEGQPLTHHLAATLQRV